MWVHSCRSEKLKIYEREDHLNMKGVSFKIKVVLFSLYHYTNESAFGKVSACLLQNYILDLIITIHLKKNR